MKISMLATIILSAVMTTTAVASESVKTLNTCTPNGETNEVSLKIQQSSEGYGILLKLKDGREFKQEGGCASLSTPGGGLTLECAIVLPGRTTGYRINVHTPAINARFAYVTYRNSEGYFPKPLMICDNNGAK